jgi:hypothetical protein
MCWDSPNSVSFDVRVPPQSQTSQQGYSAPETGHWLVYVLRSGNGPKAASPLSSLSRQEAVIPLTTPFLTLEIERRSGGLANHPYSCEI